MDIHGVLEVLIVLLKEFIIFLYSFLNGLRRLASLYFRVPLLLSLSRHQLPHTFFKSSNRIGVIRQVKALIGMLKSHHDVIILKVFGSLTSQHSVCILSSKLFSLSSVCSNAFSEDPISNDTKGTSEHLCSSICTNRNTSAKLRLYQSFLIYLFLLFRKLLLCTDSSTYSIRFSHTSITTLFHRTIALYLHQSVSIY